MSSRECDQLVTTYLDWLRQEFSTEALEGGCEITTPFLDRHNDHLQVYAVKTNGAVVLSDDGYILADLRASGLDLGTEKRQAVLDATLKGFGVRIDQERLLVDASSSNLGRKLHCLMQAMLAVNDMFVMAQPRVTTFFWEDVRAFLDEHEVRYSPRVKIAGKSGFDHAIDFLIPKSKERPERFLQAINVPSKNTIGTYLFALGDTREARGDQAEAYAILNDSERNVGGDILEALEAYKVSPIPWSLRDEIVQKLVA
jgi:hypothetical protein